MVQAHNGEEAACADHRRTDIGLTEADGQEGVLRVVVVGQEVWDEWAG